MDVFTYDSVLGVCKSSVKNALAQQKAMCAITLHRTGRYAQ